MTPADGTDQAAAILWDCWQRGECLAALPEALRPRSRVQGYAIQAALAARSASPIFGWKIAATSAAGQAHIVVDGPLAGRILRERVFASGDTVPLGHNRMRVAEAEFAFRMDRDLPPRDAAYAVDEVMAAVAALHPAIELPDSRYSDFTVVGAPQLIADSACAHQFVLGAEAPASWRSIDLAVHTARGSIEGGATREGLGAHVLGDPRAALAWLVNELSSLGVTLRGGDIVTTGTCLVPLAISAGDRVTMDFGRLGHVEARIGD